MKTLLILAFAGLGMSPLYAQKLSESELPKEVSASFKKAYPEVKNVKWEKEDSDFEANFTQNKTATSVVIDAMGMVKEVETEINKTALPSSIQKALKKDYAAYKIEKAERTIANDVSTYEVEVEKGKETLELVYDSTGKLLKKEIKEDRD